MNQKEKMQAREQQLEAKHQAKLRAERHHQSNRSSTIVIYIIFATTLLVFAILVAILLGDGWYNRQLTGFGIVGATIRTSLFEITFDVKCGKNSIEDMICLPILQAARGTYSLHGAQSDLCVLNSAICSTFSQVYQCSFIIFGAVALTFITQLLGLMVLANYWFVSPLPRLKQWAFILLGLGFLFLLSGIIVWTLLVPDLALILNMINSASAVAGQVTGDILSYKDANDLPMYGWCWLLGLFACFIQLVQFAFVVFNFHAQEGEDKAIEEEYAAYDEQHHEQMALIMAQADNAGQQPPYYGTA